MDHFNRIEYRIRDLSTSHVTLFPSQAQITRDLKNVPLKPGINEILVVGLTPTIDEHSVKVTGTGSTAVFTGIFVELLPNRELFHDVYPDSDDDEKETDTGEDEENEKMDETLDGESKQERVKLKKLMKGNSQTLTDHRDDQLRMQDMMVSAAMQLKILNAFGESPSPAEGNIDIKDVLRTYDEERKRIFKEHMEATKMERNCAQSIAECLEAQESYEKRLSKLDEKANETRRKAIEAKQKEQEKERLRKAEGTKEKERIRRQREQFWPRCCYAVRITVDASKLTPDSSRSASIANIGDLANVNLDKENSTSSGDTNSCNITLSYVTTSAFWSPSYDLALSTTTSTANLCFDASLTNMTSETWSNCKVTLSNSQTTLSLKSNTIPTMKPWYIKLAGKDTASGKGSAPRNNPDSAYNDILASREELAEKEEWAASQNANTFKPRFQLFGVDRAYPLLGNSLFRGPVQNQTNAGTASSGFRSQSQPPAQAEAANGSGLSSNSTVQGSSLFGSSQGPSSGSLFGQNATQSTQGPPSGGLFGQSASHPPQAAVTTGAATGGGLFGGNLTSGPSPFGAPRQAGLFGQSAAQAPQQPTVGGLFGSATVRNNTTSAQGDWENEKLDEFPTVDPTPELSFLESSFEETGLTTKYDLLGLKTLKPASIASKHRVANISFSEVKFVHTVVAKYKPAAFLEAKLQNPSRLTLLKGPVGLVLDNTFIGRSTLPPCSAWGIFSLSLGVDSAIKVSYPKPDVKRSTSGLFSKEDSSIHTRTITLRNTRAAAAEPVKITVLDQVPVSEDEKLRVAILQPRGLVVGGNAVVTGRSSYEGDLDWANWGRATAMLKKAGEVNWDVELNASRHVTLTLEYEVALPTGEHALQY